MEVPGKTLGAWDMKKQCHRKRLEASGRVVNILPAMEGPLDIFEDTALVPSTSREKKEKKLALSAGYALQVYQRVDPHSVLGVVTGALGWSRQGPIWGGAISVQTFRGTEQKTLYINHVKLEKLAKIDKEDVPRELLIEASIEDEAWLGIAAPSPALIPSPRVLFLEKRLELGI